MDKIYKLLDPITLEIMYIGKTKSSNIYMCLINKVQQSGGYRWSKEKLDNINPYRKGFLFKEIHQFTKTGVYLRSYTSAKAVPNINSKLIYKCCLGETKSCKGFIFSYDKDKFKI